MNKYLSILKGVNVSGQKKILMKDLKVLYEELGFKNIQTYIQSDNIIFESNNVKNLAKKLSKNIRKVCISGLYNHQDCRRIAKYYQKKIHC